MNKRIIVIDDEPAVLQDYTLILSPVHEEMDDLARKAALQAAELFGEPEQGEKTALVEEYFDVTTALQGREGFEKVKSAGTAGKPFALAFIDIRMPPGWDGLETARQIRQVDPQIEIVIVTAYSDKQRREIVARVGSPDKLLYLKKPFDPDEIRQLALALTQKWALERQAVRHRKYLERLLDSVRRLKTPSVTSVKEIIEVMLHELLFLTDARKGLIAKLADQKIEIEVVSETLSAASAQKLMDQIGQRLAQADKICWIDNIMVFPLADKSGSLFFLVLDCRPPVSESRIDLLKLFLEASSEVLESVRKHEQYIKNEKIATIGQISAGLIHEINNPLMAMSGAAEIIRMVAGDLMQIQDAFDTIMADPELADSLRQRMETLRKKVAPEKIRDEIDTHYAIIENGQKRIKRLMRNIRGFSSAREAFHPEFGNIVEAFEDTLMLAHNALKYGVRVNKQWESPLMANFDLGGLKQVFLNLILNAVHAMGGRGELTVTGRSVNGRVRISVKDTGSGISAADQKRIFEAFFTTKDTGTGLGLSIARRIVEKHHGTIWVESEPGRGSEFFVEIPEDFSVSNTSQG